MKIYKRIDNLLIRMTSLTKLRAVGRRATNKLDFFLMTG